MFTQVFATLGRSFIVGAGLTVLPVSAWAACGAISNNDDRTQRQQITGYPEIVAKRAQIADIQARKLFDRQQVPTADDASPFGSSGGELSVSQCTFEEIFRAARGGDKDRKAGQTRFDRKTSDSRCRSMPDVTIDLRPLYGVLYADVRDHAASLIALPTTKAAGVAIPLQL